MSSADENNAPDLAREVELRRFDGTTWTREPDPVATESPLEIRVEGSPLAVVMRTPGHDEELAAGFLLTEGAIAGKSDIFEVSACPSQQDTDDPDAGDVVDVVLSDPDKFDPARFTRHVFTSSSCGICGRATIEAACQNFPPIPPSAGDEKPLTPALLSSFPTQLRAAQEAFAQTGGLHACGLFDLPSGKLLCIREDVGRHNALDKVLGRALFDKALPLTNAALMVSGRVSFELMQKALAAGIPTVAAISAPTSLAVDFARRSGQTLVGFLRGEKMNVYAGAGRIEGMTNGE